MDDLFRQFIDRVRMSADIIDVIGGYVQLKKKGSKHWACCPFHGEKTPSFAVDSSKQLFYCFGCHIGGDVFKFIQQKEGINFIEAAKRLAERCGIPVPEREKSQQDLLREKEFHQVTSVNNWAARYFAACLRHESVGSLARQYLFGRGITETIINDFQIGYARGSYSDLQLALLDKGLMIQQMIKAGVVLTNSGGSYYDKFRDRIMIPIKDSRGNIVGFGGRVLGNGEPKYLNTGQTDYFNKRYLLFGFDIAQKYMRDSKQAVVVEGYMDAISLHAAGFRNVVASMGTAFSEQQCGILKRNTGEVIFCYDSDVPGRNASIRAVSVARSMGIPVRVALVPGAKDPDEFVRAEGADAFKKVLDQAVPGLEFQIAEVLNRQDISSFVGKVTAVREIVVFLLECNNEMEVNDQLRKLAQKLTVEEALILDELNKVRRRKQGRYSPCVSYAHPVENMPVSEHPTERLLMALLVQNPDIDSLYADKLKKIEWQSDVLRRLFTKLTTYLAQNGTLSGFEMQLDGEESSLLVSLKLENIPGDDMNKVCSDCLSSLYINQLERRYNIHAALAAEYEKNSDVRMMDELKICQEIRNEIKKICND